MRTQSRRWGLWICAGLGITLAGCSGEAEKPATDAMSPPASTGKMEGGAMEGGKMEGDKMKGGAMGGGKMEGEPKP